jgi:hypothetical protein
MSIKVVVYMPASGTDFIIPITERFAELGMECQFHPGFALDFAKDPGEVRLRMRVRNSSLSPYQRDDMLSNFELAYKDFRYTSPLAVNPATNEKLKSCTKQAIVRMHATHTSAYRAGMYFAALLCEAANGVVYMPRSDLYLESAEALGYVKEEVEKYESELPVEDWRVEPFTGW